MQSKKRLAGCIQHLSKPKHHTRCGGRTVHRAGLVHGVFCPACGTYIQDTLVLLRYLLEVVDRAVGAVTNRREPS